MQTYRTRLISEIKQMPEIEVKKIYELIHFLTRRFNSKEAYSKGDWRDDFRSISVWEDDNFGEIERGMRNWKIEKF